MKTLIVGLGNPILGDDGVGWVVVEEVKKRLTPDLCAEVDCLSLGGLSLMERLVGYERAILVDAFVSDAEDGTVMVSGLDELPDFSAFHLTSAHDMSLQNAMKLGKQLGVDLPQHVLVVGVSARHIYDFSEELSPPVKEAVPQAAQIVVELLTQKVTIH